MAEFASRGVGAAGLTTGIVGSTLGAMSTGIIPNLFGGGARQVNSEDVPVNRYELQLSQQLEAEKSKNALLESYIYTDKQTDAKTKEVRAELKEEIADLSARVERLDRRVCKDEQENAVFAAGVNGTVSCMQKEIARLYSLTKTVIDNDSICPGWGPVTVAPTTATTPTTAG